MKLIKASSNILFSVDGNEIIKRIERAGRTCYKSENKITDTSAESFVKMLIEKGHESVLEHETVTVLFICDRGVSHELVRHRIASFSQESTRYCNYGSEKHGGELTFIIPFWFKTINEGRYESLQPASPLPIGRDKGEHIWINSMSLAEVSYKMLLECKWAPQQARAILPNSLKTEVVVTANLREWRTILKQRTSIAAHPQMREIMIPLLIRLQKRVPIVFDDIII